MRKAPDQVSSKKTSRIGWSFGLRLDRVLFSYPKDMG
jgi:hypothetical protein